MKTFYALAVVLLLCITAVPPVTAAKGDKGAGKSGKLEIVPQAPKPTQEGVVAWADKYYKKYEPKLEKDNKETIESIKTALFMNKGVPFFMDDTISKLVTELTLSLAAKKPFDVLVCASALLVKTQPKNARVINLFGSVLFRYGKVEEAQPVIEYGLSLKPKNFLLRLNLANIYLDTNKDEKAKTILDKLVFEEPDDQAVWRALATYWYKRNDMAQFRQCLLKSAKFKGYAKKKADKKNKKVEDNEAKGDESPEQLEPKLKELATSEPFTSADILEDDYPAQAQQIRDKYCKLAGDETWRLPKIPMCNVNGPREYHQNAPIIEEWIKVFAIKQEQWARQQATEMGIDLKAPKKVQEAQARAAAKKQMADAMKSAQDMLKYMKNIPGMKGVNNKAKINDAMKQLEKAAKGQGVKLPKDAPKSSSEDEGDDSGEGENTTDMSKIPGFDSGTPWAQMNYRNYLNTERTYGIYFMKYFKEYTPKVMDIYKVYGQKVKGEDERFDEEWKQLQEEHNGPNNPHGETDAPCRRAQINHKKMLNQIALDYYHQWSNLYFPQYAQKMKPTLDAYWDVCMIYVRNMNDPQVMKREFKKVKNNFLFWAMQAGGHISGGGGFKYYPETDEEERKLEADIAAAKEEAEQKKPEFAREFKSPDFDFSKWMEDHFVLEIAGEVFALKITAKTVEFEANAVIFQGNLKYNVVDNVLESSSSIAVKANVGVNICGFGAKVEEKMEFAKRTATWDLDNNTYKETNSAKGEAKFIVGPVAVGGEVELDSELNAKTTSKLTVMEMYTIQKEAEFPSQ